MRAIGYGSRIVPDPPAGGLRDDPGRMPARSLPPARQGATTRAGGTISVDTVWDAAIVSVTDDITITNDALLTVVPGVRIEFAGYFGILVVDGAIQAAGKADNPITWTTSYPEAFDESQSTAGCWNGITFLNLPAGAPESYLRWCVLEYAKAVPGLGLDGDGPRVGGRAFDGAGGALRIVGSSRVEVMGCRLRRNCADRGGALAVHYGGAPVVMNSLLLDNVSWSRAGAVFVSYAYPVFWHDTLTLNRCVNPEMFDRTAGAVDHFHGKPLYTGCVIYANQTNHHEHHEVLEPKAYYTRYCDIAGFGEGVGCLDQDPLFVTHGSGRLSAGSPCRNAGSYLLAEQWLPEVDLDGFPRREGPEVDMGCYEFTPVSAADVATPVLASDPRAWPNPCNPSTTVRFRIERTGRARLCILDQRGRLVRTLVDGELPAGELGVEWNGLDDGGRGAASGTYVIRLDNGGRTRTGSLTLVR
ncbi:hypothetical protein KKG45_12980 [bacterium]|nr:hypothetical protein [bacterium]